MSRFLAIVVITVMLTRGLPRSREFKDEMDRQIAEAMHLANEIMEEVT